IVAVVAVAGRSADAVGYRIGVAVSVEADEESEWSRRLQGDDIAEREIAQEAVFRAFNAEVGDETLTNVLVGIGVFQRAIVEILGRAEERREGAVVECMRPSVISVKGEDSVESFGQLESEAVVIGIAGVVCVIEQAGIGKRGRAAGIDAVVEERLSCRPCWRRSFWCGIPRNTATRSSGSDAGNRRAGGGAERRADVEVFGTHEVVRRNKQVAGAECEAPGDFAVTFQVGLFRVGDLAVVLHHARTCGAGRRTLAGDELGWDLPRRDQCRGGCGRESQWTWSHLVQDPGCGVGTLANSGQGFAGDDYGPLRLGDEQEGQVVTIIEDAEAGADDRLTVGRPGQTDARLDAVVVPVNLFGKARFEIIAQTVVEGEGGRYAPLILRVEAVVGVIQSFRKVYGFAGDICVRPVRGNRRRSGELAVGGRLHGAYRRAPENDGNAVQRLIVVVGPERSAGLRGEERSGRRGARTIGGVGRNARGWVYKVGEVHQAIQAGHDDAHGSEARPDDEVVDVVEIDAEFRDVISFDPGQGIGELKTAFIDGIENAEIVAEEQSVRDIEVRLTGNAGEIIVTAGILREEGIDEVGLQSSGHIADERLIAHEKIVTAAGCADAAAVESAADELIQVAAVFDVVAEAQVTVRVQLVVKFGDAVVIVLGLQNRI